MAGKVNIDKCFERFDDLFSPKIVGELNGQYVLVVRCEGDKVPWHIHDGEDEMFLVLGGELEIHEKAGPAEDAEPVVLGAGEFYIVPAGVEHRVVPRGHVRLMLFEPAGIKHTGDVESEITKDKYERLEV